MPRKYLICAFTVAAVVSACGEPTPTTPEAEPSASTPAAASAPSESPAPATTPAVSPPAAAARSAVIPPEGLTASNANGVQLKVSAVTFGPDSTSVAVQIINGSERTLKLNSSGGRMVLLDDAGTVMRVQPPADNEFLDVEAGGGVLEGQLVFIGVPATQATFLTLDSNDESDDTTDTMRPSLTIDIPLQ